MFQTLPYKKLTRIGDWGFFYSKKKGSGWAVDVRVKGVNKGSEIYSLKYLAQYKILTAIPITEDVT